MVRFLKVLCVSGRKFNLLYIIKKLYFEISIGLKVIDQNLTKNDQKNGNIYDTPSFDIIEYLFLS